MPKELRLLADSYDQPQKDDTPERRRLAARSKGEVFAPVSDEEYARLVGSGAAEDPTEVRKRAREDAERRLEQLKAEQERIEQEIKGASAAKAPEKLSGRKLDEALSARALSTEGTVEEKRDRLAQAVTAENPPPPPA